MSIRTRSILLTVVVALMSLAVAYLFPTGQRTLLAVRQHAYVYDYEPAAPISTPDLSQSPPARSVPILMYHGVRVQGVLGDNTTRETFIGQLEALKRAGYETITVAEYDRFRNGEFILPPKPVILTFDDGRRDSYYTVDRILERLGYRATMFVATAKANGNDGFYLSWEELSELRESGRWEIEAHNRDAHATVAVDEQGTTGMFLTSRRYRPGIGLETVAEYEARVEADYRGGITDLEERLGVTPRYLAIPLNDYGDRVGSNHDGAYELNLELTKKYFTLAFVQCRSTAGRAETSFYNGRYADSYALKRLEVKNLDPEELLLSLERFAPVSPPVSFAGEYNEKLQNAVEPLYGEFAASGTALVLASSSSTPSARVLFGNGEWTDYRTTVTFDRDRGQSVSVFHYYLDEKNYIVLSRGGRSLWVSEWIDGEERRLADVYPWNRRTAVTAEIAVENGALSVLVNGKPIVTRQKVALFRGAAGFGVWDPEGARSSISALLIEPLSDR